MKVEIDIEYPERTIELEFTKVNDPFTVFWTPDVSCMVTAIRCPDYRRVTSVLDGNTEILMVEHFPVEYLQCVRRGFIVLHPGMSLRITFEGRKD